MYQVMFKAPYGIQDSSPKLEIFPNGWRWYRFRDMMDRPIALGNGTIIWEPPNCDGVNPETNPGSSSVFLSSDTGKRDKIFIELDRARVDWLIDILRTWRETGKLK